MPRARQSIEQLFGEERRVGRLKIVEEAEARFTTPGRGPARRFRCICDCGKETIVDGSNLQRMSVRSCGCLKREAASARERRRKEAHPSGTKGDASVGLPTTIVGDDVRRSSEELGKIPLPSESSGDFVTVLRSEFESLVAELEQLRRFHSVSDPIGVSSISFAVPAPVRLAIARGHTPLAAWRLYRGYSQEELSARAGLSQSTVARLEMYDAGEDPPFPRYATRRLLLRALDIPEHEAWTLDPACVAPMISNESACS